MNLIRILNVSFSIPIEQVAQGIAVRADVVYPDTHRIEQWIDETHEVPTWANYAAAKWLIELWMDERNQCTADTLLNTDKKYTAYLNTFSLAEIIPMQQASGN